MNEYAHLFEPIQIGSLTLKNRIVMGPMGTNFGEGGGEVSARTIRHYTLRAKNGVGLILTEAMAVHPSGAHRKNAMSLTQETFVPSLIALTDSVHAEGGAIAAQLSFAGRVVPHAVQEDGGAPWGASRLRHRLTGVYSREMTEADIHAVVASFAEAADRAKRSGFDGVEIHGTHGYLPMQFFSPLWNHRTDGYGGSRECRARFALEIAQAVRRAVGADYPVLYRLAGEELIPGGQTLEDAVYLARELEGAGISAIHVSGGNNETPADMKNSIGTMYREQGYFVAYAQRIKEAVSVPVIAVGRLGNPDLAEAVVARGAADLICLGRTLLAEPEWVKKLVEGRGGELIPCVACNMGCIEQLSQQHAITCVQNPALGREECVGVRTDAPKRILVAGAGVGGLEFAIRAAERGHSVTVWEAGTSPGGQAVMAARAPQKEIFQELVDTRLNRLKQLGVTIEYGKRCTAENTAGFDVVADATGGLPKLPDDPWSHAPIVRNAFDLLSNPIPAVLGENAVVVGGGSIGLESAHLLAERGYRVTVVELGEVLGVNLVPTVRFALIEALVKEGISFLTSTMVTDVRKNVVWMQSGEEKHCIQNVGMVVLAIGVVGNKHLSDELVRAGITHLKIGSCCGAGNALDTVLQAFSAGIEV